MLKGVNWIAVAVGVVALEILGFLWYGPLFGTQWQAALGRVPETANGNLLMGLGVVNSIIIVSGLAWLTGRLGAASLVHSVTVALTAWFFFDFTTQALEYLYMGMSQQLVLINMGYQFVSYTLAGAVLALVKFGRPAAAAA